MPKPGEWPGRRALRKEPGGAGDGGGPAVVDVLPVICLGEWDGSPGLGEES